MSLPQPEVALTDACSVIFNNTLYTYSAAAFQSLELSTGAEWTKLPQGEQVTGGVCVGSTPSDPSTAGFFVVGGTANSSDYQGMQKFTYSTGQWESIMPVTPVVQDRIGHGAVYINDSDTILVYAGAQDGSMGQSTQTFTIGASPPNAVLAYSSIAPPTTNPILLPWSATEAVLIGGSTTNTQVMVFNPTTASWMDSGASLAYPLMKDSSSIQAMMMDGDDGSKNLYTFDMSVSPNVVNQTVLIDGSGAPVQSSAPVSKRWAVGDGYGLGLERRASNTLTEQDWPPYNATLASTSTRTNYAMSSNENGLVVISGGNAEDVLCVFNARSNSWVNATAMFAPSRTFVGGGAPFPVVPSSTSSLVSSSAPSIMSVPSAAAVTAPATPTPAGPATGSGVIGTNTILGAILGSIIGLALALCVLYWCIRRRRQRQAHQELGHARRASGESSSEKDGTGFASDSFPQPPMGSGVFRGHQTQDSQSSFSSMAILMGRFNQQRGGQAAAPRNLSSQSRRDSGDSAYNKAFKSAISKPIPQVAQGLDEAGSLPLRSGEDKGVSFAPDTADPRPRNPALAAARDADGATRRSSGWNRYWSGGSALSMLGFGNGSNNANNNANNNTNNNANNNMNSNAARKRATAESQSSQYSNTNVHRITQDSATVPPLNVYDKSPRASFSRVNSFSPTILQYNSQLKEEMSGQIERPVSAISETSGYSSGIPASVHEIWDPTQNHVPWGMDRAPSSAYSGSVYTTALAPPSQQGSRQSTLVAPDLPKAGMPLGVSRQPQLAKAATSDMSWLNLGEPGSGDPHV